MLYNVMKQGEATVPENINTQKMVDPNGVLAEKKQSKFVPNKYIQKFKTSRIRLSL